MGDASQDFRNKFVFHSPKIITATDFSIDTPQDVFIYIRGETLTSDECLQQTTRTRNIRALYWYSESKQQDPHYDSLDQLKDLMQTSIVTSKSINNCCTYIDANDECKMVENMWFNLWAYNEYIKDAYRTNITLHYKLLLEANGFIIHDTDKTPQPMPKQTKSALSDVADAEPELSLDHFCSDGVPQRAPS